MANQDVCSDSGGRCCDRSGKLRFGLVFPSLTLLLRELESEVLKKISCGGVLWFWFVSLWEFFGIYWPLGPPGSAGEVAAEMASRRVRSLTGLRRKADAPPAMARSRAFGKSWPVTMMTGSAAHFRARCVCTLNPFTCGMCRSRTTQSGRRVSSDFKNSAPEPNVSTLKPAERINRISALRTDSSSSMTAISG